MFLNLNLEDDISMGSTIEIYLEMVITRRYIITYTYIDSPIELDNRVLYV